MAIPNRQIGWSPKAILLHTILKELDSLNKIAGVVVYNSNLPTLINAEVPTTGDSIILSFNKIMSTPTQLTDFIITINGIISTPTLITFTPGSTQYILTPNTLIYEGDIISITILKGNITSLGGVLLEEVIDYLVNNWSLLNQPVPSDAITFEAETEPLTFQNETEFLTFETI